jgi:hypothetical protein
MPQLHLYVSDDAAVALRARAEEAGLSLSRYLARLVGAQVHTGWPPGYFEAVAGSCPDFAIPPDPPEDPVRTWA